METRPPHHQHQHQEQYQQTQQGEQNVQTQNAANATASPSHHQNRLDRLLRLRTRERVANACDVCKLRKIKCTGTKPCAYCVKKGLPDEMCHYTGNSKTQRTQRYRTEEGTLVNRPPPVTVLVGTTAAGSASSSGEGGASGLISSGRGTAANSGFSAGGHEHQQQQQQQQSQTPRSDTHSSSERRRRRSRRRSRRGSLTFRTITTTPREEEDSHEDDEEDGSENDEEPDDTEVPRDARLVRDPQGKLIFIGDCAPLSFFQTVRRLVTSRVDAAAFDGCGGGGGGGGSISLGAGLDGTGTGTAAVSGAGGSSTSTTLGSQGSGIGPPLRMTTTGSWPPGVDISSVHAAVEAYLAVTSGLVDLFEDGAEVDGLQDSILTWAGSLASPTGTATADATSAVNYLVLAIGHQAIHSSSASSSSEADPSQLYFEYARTLAFADLGGNFGIGSLQGVQVHILIAIYMLFLHQTNGAFLFFGIAARAAYSIGIHRTEINARFGEGIKRLREKIWRSLRVVDLFLSTSMGRPPAASDVDCTVGYSDELDKGLNLLNASVQVLLITERVVLQVYSRRKISVQLTEGISRELRDWSSRWLGGLKEVVDGKDTTGEEGRRMRKRCVNGACQVLASYYYAVILVSRPFLMVELHHRLAGTAAEDGNGLVSGRTKLADACIDAAVLMVSPVQDLIARGEMARRAPVVVSWLFAASLVLGLGLLGGFGRVIEKHCRASIAALEYFADSDAHAVQYSLIAKSLLTTALGYLERQETLDRLRRTESSSQIFGLLSRESVQQGHAVQPEASASTITVGTAAVEDSNMIFGESAIGKGHKQYRSLEHEVLSPPRTNNNFAFSSSFFGFGGESSLPRTPEFSSLMGVSMDDADDTFGAMNLFPLLDSDGIDLTNLF
ncbi:hypothetical protein V8F33_008338 [Rhypophila sp. PSN 637]